VTIFLVHFRALGLDVRYLKNALYSLRQQDHDDIIDQIIVFDNDSELDPIDIMKLIKSFNFNVYTDLIYDKHGDPNKRCQSWSVNECFRNFDPRFARNDWILFTRSDYILDFNLVKKFDEVVQSHPSPWRGFVTSYAYHMAYDERNDQRIIGYRDLEPTNWRTEGTQRLLEGINGWKVDSSNTDAGVWLTRHSLWDAVGGLNENLKAWGLQQTVFQQALTESGVEVYQIPEYLFFHQHHGGEFRDYDKAIEELEEHWGPKEKLSSFRNLENFLGKVNDETPRS
jgi:hypothetical protein